MRIKHYKFVLLGTILVLFAVLQESDSAKKHQVIVRFSRLVCRIYNHAVIQSLNCSLVKDDITKELVLNIDIMGARTINNLKLKNKLLLDRSGTITKFYDEEINICEILTARFEFFLFRMVLEEVHRSSNLPLNCPFNKNVLYYLHNFTISSKYFPPFFPNLEWSSYINFTVDNRKLFGMEVFGSLVRKMK